MWGKKQYDLSGNEIVVEHPDGDPRRMVSIIVIIVLAISGLCAAWVAGAVGDWMMGPKTANIFRWAAGLFVFGGLLIKFAYASYVEGPPSTPPTVAILLWRNTRLNIALTAKDLWLPFGDSLMGLQLVDMSPKPIKFAPMTAVGHGNVPLVIDVTLTIAPPNHTGADGPARLNAWLDWDPAKRLEAIKELLDKTIEEWVRIRGEVAPDSWTEAQKNPGDLALKQILRVLFPGEDVLPRVSDDPKLPTELLARYLGGKKPTLSQRASSLVRTTLPRTLAEDEAESMDDAWGKLAQHFLALPSAKQLDIRAALERQQEVVRDIGLTKANGGRGFELAQFGCVNIMGITVKVEPPPEIVAAAAQDEIQRLQNKAYAQAAAFLVEARQTYLDAGLTEQEATSAARDAVSGKPATRFEGLSGDRGGDGSTAVQIAALLEALKEGQKGGSS